MGETIDVKLKDVKTGYVFTVTNGSVRYEDGLGRPEMVAAALDECDRVCPHKLSGRTVVEFEYRSTGNPARICLPKDGGLAYIGNGKPGCRALQYVNGQ